MSYENYSASCTLNPCQKLRKPSLKAILVAPTLIKLQLDPQARNRTSPQLRVPFLGHSRCTSLDQPPDPSNPSKQPRLARRPRSAQAKWRSPGHTTPRLRAGSVVRRLRRGVASIGGGGARLPDLWVLGDGLSTRVQSTPETGTCLILCVVTRSGL